MKWYYIIGGLVCGALLLNAGEISFVGNVRPVEGSKGSVFVGTFPDLFQGHELTHKTELLRYIHFDFNNPEQGPKFNFSKMLSDDAFRIIGSSEIEFGRFQGVAVADQWIGEKLWVMAFNDIEPDKATQFILASNTKWVVPSTGQSIRLNLGDFGTSLTAGQWLNDRGIAVFEPIPVPEPFSVSMLMLGLLFIFPVLAKRKEMAELEL